MEKVWLKNYPAGVPAEVNVRKYNSVVDILEESFRLYALRPAYHHMGRNLTFQQVERLSSAFAAFLQKRLELKKGDRIAIMLPNCLQYPIVLFGALRAGLTVVNVNPLYTARELEHQLLDSGAETIVILENFAHVLENALPKTPMRNVLVTELGDFLGFPKGMIVNRVVRHIKKMVPKWQIPGTRKLTRAVAQGHALEYTRPVLNQDDLAFLQYTGGTTGRSKGAMLTHGNIVANVVQVRAWINSAIVPGQEIIITALPLYHVFSLTANCIIYGSSGCLNILITNPKDIPGFVKELSKHRWTTITGVNTLFNALMNNPDFAKLDFSGLKLALGGAMAVQRATAERWKKMTGVSLLEGYGLTECSPVVCVTSLEQKEYSGNIGMPIPSTEISVRDDDGREVGLNEAGELWVRGPQVMKGYWGRPEDTDQVLREGGWLATGDVGQVDTAGYVKIVDRKKDMILVSGFNVYPNEIEDVVASMPGVLEVAAVGVPSERSGEEVKLFIVKKDQALTVDAVMAHCRENLTGYKLPRHIEFRGELPKTNVGKILRRELRSPAR